MYSLHFFNPDNDLALARGVENYTPPRMAMWLRQAGEALPLWYGAPGDKVWTRGINERWFAAMAEAFGLQTGLFGHSYTPEIKFKPWGWSAAMRKAYIDDGCPAEYLPSKEQLEKLRQLAHRRTAADMLRALIDAYPDMALPMPAVEARSEAQFLQMLAQTGDAMVKMPWSGSGRGVVGTRRGMAEAMQVAMDSIRKQGSVMIEPEYDKKLDFAKLFECENGRCRCIGTSVFMTDDHQRYAGNLLASEEKRLERVGEVCDLTQLETLTQAITRLIQDRIAPCYEGVVGVDMMAYGDGQLHPMVEINLRCTMGYVANAIADRYLAPGATGRYEVMPALAADEPSHPLAKAAIENGKLAAGELLLTPPNGKFAFKVSLDS